MNWAQRELLEELHFSNIILKARQLGFTTFIQIYMLDVAVFYPDTRCGVIAQTQPDAMSIFREKIKYPYDNLPEAVKRAVPIVSNNASELHLGNNSHIRVGTSLRGGTLQYLHISEFGKICAKFPEKAREIITGALNTIQAGQFVFIESTAEGQEGKFYEMCQLAQSKTAMGTRLTELDYKFHFFPWWREPAYSIDPEGVTISAEFVRHFEELEAAVNITLTDGQKAWYVKKAETQAEDMGREFPGTPEEAFAAAIEGAFYGAQMAKVEKDKRIQRVPYEPELDVETWWDLGVDDATAIWFVQRLNREVRIIDYYEMSGEGLAHFAKVLKDKDYRYSYHVLPHDVAVTELGTGKSRKEVAESMGIKPITVAPRLEVADGIEAVRNMLSRCYFDEEKCSEGVKALKNYRKHWNEDMGVWSSKPRHDWSSHASDAFRYGAVTPFEDNSYADGPIHVPNFGAV